MDSNETPEGKDVHRPRAFTRARRGVLTGVLAVVVSAGAVSLATAATSHHHAANAGRPAAAKAVTVAAKTKSTTKKSTATHKCPNMNGGVSGGSSS
jgi:hypothetical protein